MQVEQGAASQGAKTKRDVLVDYTQEDDDDETMVNEPDELYDAQVDEKDEKWANKQRQGRQSDAVLSCPACFTTLCIDCQRHEKYHTQYRAMFVRNCKIIHDEVYQDKPSSTKRKRNNSANNYVAGNDEEILRPVRCDVCNVDVGVWDPAQEIYHFYNAIPSYS